MFTGKLATLEQNLKKLPGIGSKSAQRLAIHILLMNKQDSACLAESILDAIEHYIHCETCNMLTEITPCEFCSDAMRNDSQLCIVESTQDVFLIDSTNEYQGKYFVLNHLLSPLDGIGPDEIHFSKLLDRIQNSSIDELILALNPSTEGESTMHFIATNVASHVNKITRLSTGLPFGGNIEYTSKLTLQNALQRRFQVKD